jgi:hypothetical protein
MEQIATDLTEIRQLLMVIAAGQGQTPATQQAAAQQGHGLNGSTPPPPAQQANPVYPIVTNSDINTLITPHINNQQIKEALSAELQTMGIDRLANARPEQLGEVYVRFENLLARMTTGGTTHDESAMSII